MEFGSVKGLEKILFHPKRNDIFLDYSLLWRNKIATFDMSHTILSKYSELIW